MCVESRKMVQMILFASTNRDTDVENRHMDTKEGKEGCLYWEIGKDIYTLLIQCIK